MLFILLTALETEEERDKLTYLYERYYQQFVKTAYKIVRSQEVAEEVVHDAFVAAIERKEKFLSLDAVNFRNLCVRVIRNKCIDILRRNKPLSGAMPLDSDDTPELSSDDDPFDLRVANQEDYARLMDCIAKLEPLNKQILEMKYVHGLTFERICAELGMTFPQVNGRLTRSRAKVKYLFEKGESL
jgi:RNA polymerase sigma-70 factor (ECF subfamily)